MLKQVSDGELAMHKLMGKHEYVKYFNADTYETEQHCTICGYIDNTKPGNNQNIDHALDAFRYGMISANEALKLLGLPERVDADLESLVSK